MRIEHQSGHSKVLRNPLCFEHFSLIFDFRWFRDAPWNQYARSVAVWRQCAQTPHDWWHACAISETEMLRQCAQAPHGWWHVWAISDVKKCEPSQIHGRPSQIHDRPSQIHGQPSQMSKVRALRKKCVQKVWALRVTTKSVRNAWPFYSCVTRTFFRVYW